MNFFPMLGMFFGIRLKFCCSIIMCLQVIVSVGSGPWDQLFGGGNSPALAVGAATGFIGGIVAILALPRTRIQKPIPLP